MKKALVFIFALCFGASVFADDKLDRLQRGASLDDLFHGKSYMTWASGGGYPLNFGTGIIGRHGGTLGLGYNLSVGMDVTSGTTTLVTGLHYSAGVRLYPFKKLFLSVTYGTLGFEKMSADNDSEGYFNTDGRRHCSGLSYTVGYDVTWGSIGIFSIDAGVAYNSLGSNWIPVVNLKIGFGAEL